MKVVLDTTHLGAIGGGENYLMRLSLALREVSDFYVMENFHPYFPEFNGFGDTFEVYNGLFKPDLYIHSSYSSVGRPIGRRNASVVFFPKKNLVPNNFDSVVAICDYSSRYILEYWGREAFVLEPCIQPSLFTPGRKEDLIISVGHFFKEADGHSKNQDVLIEAFQDLPGYKFELYGNAQTLEDKVYVQYCKEKARGKNVEILLNKPHKDIRNAFARAKYLWHGNGYGRSDPAQTEHFGIIVLEAIASGCIPIVYNSGGASEIAPYTWEKPGELSTAVRTGGEVPGLRKQFTVPYFNKKVAKWLKDVSM
jgi:glycosyltransferase involved in cell wall biosynthesis